MQSTEDSISFWEATSTRPELRPLSGNAGADVCVIGAGIAGLTTALLLARDGHDVMVLDRAGIGGGETGQTSAHLASGLDDGFDFIERCHGPDKARLAHQSHAAAIDWIEKTVDDNGIDCRFRRVNGYLFLHDESAAPYLEKELAAGLRAGAPITRTTLPSPLSATGPVLGYANQARFHPLLYLLGLARLAEEAGVRIHTGTEVTESPRGGETITVETSGGRVEADRLVVATNYPITPWLTIVPRLSAYRTYVVSAPIAAGSFPDGLFWDTAEPYHYVRTTTGNDGSPDRIVVGGEDHRTGQEQGPAGAWDRLREWVNDRFQLEIRPDLRWSGQVLEPTDGLAFIGAHPGEENVFVITGDSGQGLTHGTIGGLLVSDLVAGRTNSWAEVFDPSRPGLGAPLETVRENLKTAVQYADLVFRSDVSDEGEIPPSCGAVVRQGVRPVAVYRDRAGGLHRRSAICPHLGCVVRWNQTEHSWDCPCHGSRFSPNGDVLTGPAVEPLEEVDD